ncbi:hypothetical protein [Natrinema sp. DC36]|uniref:hypothetical protein n=1 Tax=Natrinema sp. DC36 TaxID=2878680 RepID=UPI001CF047C2|nr:hypothetical protein [Natrinema sp. DC36]
MKRSLLSGSLGSSETDIDEQVQEAVVDTIRESNDKTVEIKPANESSGRKMLPLLVLIGGAFAAGYWLRKSQKATQKLQSVASETADRTKQMTEQAADTIQEGGETMADRVEEGSQKAGEQVQQTGESAAEKTEQAGEKAAEKADESGSAGSSSSS